MSLKEVDFELLDTKSELCRICATWSNTAYDIYEAEYLSSATMLSLHTMLIELVPSAFNAEQIKLDESMNWPRNICKECKLKVLDAYSLHELCVESADRLKKHLTASNSQQVITHAGAKLSSDKLGVVSKKAQKPISRRSLRNRKAEIEEIVVGIDSQTIESSEPNVQTDATGSSTNQSYMLTDDRTINSEEDDKQTIFCSEETSLLSPSIDGNQISAQGKVNKSRATKKRTKKKSLEIHQLELLEPQDKTNLSQCLLCDGTPHFAANELTEHLKAEHLEQIHSCDKCPKVFMNEQTFQHHQYCHATGRSFFCTFCDKGFQTQQLLNNHVRTHTHSTGFLCSHCGKEFSDRSNLHQHEKRHSGDKPWACNLCPSRFSTKGYLTVHLHTHTRIKAFSCSTCGSQFNRHYSLVKHQVIHTGERHYACEVCKMRFASAYHVKIHMRTHTGEKPYKCKYCGRGFAQKNDMLKHTKTHGKPFPCDQCEATFPLLNDLRNHWKEHVQAGKYEQTQPSVEQ